MLVVFDLRWFIFIGLLTVSGAAIAAVWLDRYLHTRGMEPLLRDFTHLQAVLESFPFGLLLLERDGNDCFANAYARRLLRLDVSPASLPAEEWASMLSHDRRSAREHYSRTGQVRSVDLDEERVVRWWVTPWDSQRDLCLIEDITTQRRAEQNSHLLISDLSHELRTPLATILTHLEILRLPEMPAETYQQSLRLAEQESRRMSRIIQSLLDLSRLESNIDFERRPVPLLPLVETIVAQLAAPAEERKITLSIKAAAQLPPVIGEEDRLRQLFLNLLDNAVKYSQHGDRVEISLHREGASVACTISDTGPGIPEADLPYVTRRFYRASNTEGVEGNGLGLALVAEIVRRHESRLEIESIHDEPGSGTCVRFVLPALPPAAGEQ